MTQGHWLNRRQYNLKYTVGTKRNEMIKGRVAKLQESVLTRRCPTNALAPTDLSLESLKTYVFWSRDTDQIFVFFPRNSQSFLFERRDDGHPGFT